MAFSDSFETLKDTAADAVQSAAQTAMTMARIAKFKMQILSEQEKIRKAYQELGRVYYKDFATDEEPDEAEYKPWCEKISDSFRRINQLRDAIAAEKCEAAAKGEPVEEEDVSLDDILVDEAPEEKTEPEA